MEFKKLKPECNPCNNRLQDVLKTQAIHSLRYLVYKDNIEVAGFILDKVPSITWLTLYRIFVLPEYRNLGIGTKILEKIEDLAISWGYQSIVLEPKPIDENISKNYLVSWYKKHGYNISKKDGRYLEKLIDQL